MKKYFFILLLISVLFSAEKITLNLKKTQVEGLKKLQPYIYNYRPKIGLVLSGGIVCRGISEVGAIKRLEEADIPIDYVAGTSMGSIVGSLKAQGFSALEIERIIEKIDWNNLFFDNVTYEYLLPESKERVGKYFLVLDFEGDRLRQGRGALAGQKSLMFLKALTIRTYDKDSFLDLPIPFSCNSTDLATGLEHVHDKGDMAKALRAASSVPLAFEPVEYDNCILVDGGVVNNLPVNLAKDMGAELVIAVNISAGMKDKEELTSLPAVLQQLLLLPSREGINKNCAAADILIEPDIDKYSFSDFDKIPEIINVGYQAADEHIEDLKKLLKKKTKNISKEDLLIFEVLDVAVTGNNLFSKEEVLQKLGVFKGGEINRFELITNMENFYQEGFIEDLQVDLSGKILISRNIKVILKEFPIVKKINFIGNTVFSDKDLYKQTNTKSELQLNQKVLKEDIKRIERLYREKGFLLAKVETVGVSPSSDLTLKLFEGEILDVNVLGNDKIATNIIKDKIIVDDRCPNNSNNFYGHKSNIAKNVFNINLVNDDIERLYSLGLFDSVDYKLERSGHGLILTYYVSEKNVNSLMLGAKYDSYNHFALQTEFALNTVKPFYPNIQCEFSREPKLELTLNNSQSIFRRKITTSFFYKSPVQVIYDNEGEKLFEYRDRHYGIDIDWHNSFGWFNRIDWVLKWQHFAQVEAVEGNDDKEMDAIGFKVNVGVNTLDDVLVPKKGIKMDLSYSSGSTNDLERPTYAKTDFGYDFYKSFTDRQTFFGNLNIGWGQKNLPLGMKYRLGGQSDLAGYHYKEFLADNVWSLRCGYRVHVFKNNYLTVFRNNGLAEELKTDWDNLLRSTGVEVLTKIAFGWTLRLSQAWTDDDRQELFFLIGNEF